MGRDGMSLKILFGLLRLVNPPQKWVKSALSFPLLGRSSRLIMKKKMEAA